MESRRALEHAVSAARRLAFRWKTTLLAGSILAPLAAGFGATPAQAQAQQQPPNIIFIMGDDIGWSNIGVYNQGIMAGRTPNLDRLAAQGMRFTD